MLTSTARTSLFALILVAGLFFWTGCDSNGADEEDANVSGTYTFTRLSFRPDATALPTANILNALAANQTSMRFFANGRFALEYRLQGSTQDLVIEGTYEIRGNRVEIRISDAFDDERDDLLIPQEFTLRTVDDGATLTAEFDAEIDLSDFSDTYSGLGSVGGMYQITISRQ